MEMSSHDSRLKAELSDQKFEPALHPPASEIPQRRQTASTWLLVAQAMALTFWASSFAAIQVGLRGYSPQSLAFLRFIVASAAIAIVAIRFRFKHPIRREWTRLIFAAICGIPIYHVSLNYAEVKVGAGSAALLINVSPVLAALLAIAMLGERLGPIGWIGTLLSFTGAAVIAITRGTNLEPRALFVLIAAAAGAIYTVLHKPILRSMSPLTFAAWAIWIGTLILLPALPRFIHEARLAPVSSTLAGVYMGIFPTAIAYGLWAKVVSHMDISRAVSSLYLVPVLAVFIAWLWLGEIPRPIALFGGAMIIVGVALVNQSKTRRFA